MITYYNNLPTNARNQEPLRLLKYQLAASLRPLCEELGCRFPYREGRGWRFGTRGSLAVRQDGIWHDFETDTGGSLIDLIMYRKALDFAEACRWAKQWLGHSACTPCPPTQASPPKSQNDNTPRALAIWSKSVPIDGTLADQYLSSRAIRYRPGTDVLRFHSSLYWRQGDSRGYAPALVALVRNLHTGKPQGIQRRYLGNGGDKHPLVRHWRSLGQIRGCAIMLSPLGTIKGPLHVCEGLEDGLSALQLGYRPVWAVMGTSGIRRFPVLPFVNKLNVLADNDARSGAGLKAALKAIERYGKTGLAAGYRMPSCKDLNELLQHLEAINDSCE